MSKLTLDFILIQFIVIFQRRSIRKEQPDSRGANEGRTQPRA